VGAHLSFKPSPEWLTRTDRLLSGHGVNDACDAFRSSYRGSLVKPPISNYHDARDRGHTSRATYSSCLTSDPLTCLLARTDRLGDNCIKMRNRSLGRLGCPYNARYRRAVSLEAGNVSALDSKQVIVLLDINCIVTD